MRFRVHFLRVILSLFGCGLILNSGCSSKDVKHIDGAGSTFVYPMMSTWADEYHTAKNVEVNYQSIGSGGGIQQMTAKTVHFGCTDGPLNEEQLAKCKDTGGDVVHIPLVMGAVVPAYNLPGAGELTFDGLTLAKIFMGDIKNWNHDAIKKLNPNANLPGIEIVVVHRSDGSGTTYVWTDYLSKISNEWAKKVGKATSVNWPAGTGQKGNEGVSAMVSRTKGSIGYIELTYALQNDIKYGSVVNKEGEPIKASLESIIIAGDKALTQLPDDLRYSITDAPGKGSYPIAGTTWAVVYTKQPKEIGPVIVDFLRWAIHDGQTHCEALHYAKLPKGLVEKADKKLNEVKFE